MIDTHCHIHSSDFDETTRNTVIAEMQRSKMKAILIGVNVEDSKQALFLSERHPMFSATVGVHPHEAELFDEKSRKLLDENIEDMFRQDSQHKIVAIGECGLDLFYHTSKQLMIQEDLFRLHIEWAKRYQKPLVIHSREAFNEMYKILSEYSDLTVIFHCFTGSKERVEKYNTLSHTIYYSFSGIITFPKSEIIQDSVLAVSEDRILAETDSPFLTPSPYRGKQNIPLYVSYVIQKIADLRSMNLQETETLLDRNAQVAFRL